ncbi:type II secretion system protein N [Marinobacter salicampi]|uniref:type II secretion system protein N n=1 Tax=Marinobacter salicampi TaxID=435907 RepID=UPI00140E6C38|nr:type II secretion system protein N [Marinobacter salicampi]
MTDSEQSSFLRPGKVVWLVLGGLLIYAVTLIVTVPAGWVWAKVAPQVPLPPQVQVFGVSGSLWDGAAGVAFDNRRFRLGWDFRAPSIVGPTLPVDFSLSSAQSDLEGNLTMEWPDRIDVAASGRVRVKEFEDLIRQSGGAVLKGDVSVDQLNLAWNDGRVEHVRGFARWPGGDVTWPMGGSYQTADLPPMEANITGADGLMSLVVAQAGQGEPAVEADIQPDGVLQIRVYKRLVDLAGQNWSGAAQPGDIIFRVSQPLLPGSAR